MIGLTVTFDEIYQLFMDLKGEVEDYTLPQSIEAQYRLIKTGCILFNRKREGHEIKADMEAEIVIGVDGHDLSENEQLLLAYCMCYKIYSDMRVELVSMVDIATKDSSLKNHKGQVESRRRLERDTEILINRLSFSMMEMTEV